MNTHKQEFEDLIQSIYPAYLHHIPINEQLGKICTYLFITDDQNPNIQKFRNECIFFQKQGFWHYYLFTRFSNEDIALGENMIWLSDDLWVTVLWKKC